MEVNFTLWVFHPQEKNLPLDSRLVGPVAGLDTVVAKNKIQVRKRWGPYVHIFVVLSPHKGSYKLDICASQTEYDLPLLIIICGLYLKEDGTDVMHAFRACSVPPRNFKCYLRVRQDLLCSVLNLH
jgi:hypothetical protein